MFVGMVAQTSSFGECAARLGRRYDLVCYLSMYGLAPVWANIADKHRLREVGWTQWCRKDEEKAEPAPLNTIANQWNLDLLASVQSHRNLRRVVASGVCVPRLSYR